MTYLERISAGSIRRGKRSFEDIGSRLGFLNRDPDLNTALTPETNLATVKEWGKQRSFFFDLKDKPQIISLLNQIEPKAADLIVAQANQIYQHNFDLLGSGPTYLGEKIDWHSDFKTGYQWNPRTYYKKIKPAPYPGGYDIKVPWELSRCQHFIRLGQAYWITGAEKYAEEYLAQISSWIEDNPWPWGVNWASTMDVAIRVVNWLWAFYFFNGSPLMTDAFHIKFRKTLLTHGRHIRKNLENTGGFTNNHYLTDLVGLIYLGILCPEFIESSEWLEFGIQEFWAEMFTQVYPDGVNFEASIPYHRLATELFLSPILLCLLNKIPVPEEVLDRLEKMLEFVMVVTKPDGTVPLIGDNDNGRLLRLTVYQPPEREWNDYRYLLAIGTQLFSRQDFAISAANEFSDAIWYFAGTAGLPQILVDEDTKPLNLGSREFSDSGLYILRKEDLYVTIDTGPVGQNGRGGHAHCDSLSVELFMNGHSLVIDPGMFTYTGDYNERNQFRSLEYHNTIQLPFLDTLDPSPSKLFQLANEPCCYVNNGPKPSSADFLSTYCFDCVSSSDPAKFIREIRLDKDRNLILIYDCVEHVEAKQIAWKWHFHPDLKANIDPNNHIVLSTSESTNWYVVPIFSAHFSFSLNEYWFSSGYGVKQKALCLNASLNGDLNPAEVIWVFTSEKGLGHLKSIDFESILKNGFNYTT